MQLTHAAAVVFRFDGALPQFLLLSSSDGLHWVLPKGHIEPNEPPAAAALRELQEEAGIIGEIVTILGIQTFKKFNKNAVAQYYLVRAVDATPATETRTLRWEERSAALRLLAFDEARQALVEGAAIVSHMPPKAT